MSVTTRDIAKYLGLSQSTVSRALQGKLVSPATVRKVHAAARKLGYRVEDTPFNRTKTRNLGILVPSITNPFFGDLISAFQHEAYLHNFHILLGLYQDQGVFREEYLEVSNWENRVDALLMVPTEDPAHLKRIVEMAEHGMPTVLLGKFYSDKIYSITTDYEAAAHQLTAHLLDFGHQRIGYLLGRVGGIPASGDPLVWDARLQGLVQAYSERGLVWDQKYVAVCDATGDDSYRAALELLSMPEPPTAVIGRNDVQALGAWKAASELGLRVPDDLAIAGFDDTELARLMDLTSVTGDVATIARRSLDILQSTASGQPPSGSSLSETIPAKIVYRSSTSAPARSEILDGVEPLLVRKP